MKINIPFSDSTKTYIRRLAAEGLKPRTITRVLQLAEITGEEPDSIVQRYRMLEHEVKETIYGV